MTLCRAISPIMKSTPASVVMSHFVRVDTTSTATTGTLKISSMICETNPCRPRSYPCRKRSRSEYATTESSTLQQRKPRLTQAKPEASIGWATPSSCPIAQ